MFAINFILNAVRQWWELPFLTKYLAGVFSFLGWLPASMTSLVILTVFFTLPIHFSKLFSLKKKKAYACHTPMPQIWPCINKTFKPINKTLKPHPLITKLDFGPVPQML